MAAGDVREIVMQIELPPETPVVRRFAVCIAVIDDGLGEGDGKIGLVEAGPAICEAAACNQGVIDNPNTGPQDFAIVVVKAVQEIEDETLVASVRKGVLMDACPRRCRQARADTAVGERNRIITGRSLFGRVAETLPVATVRIVFRPGIQLQRAGLRHDEDVPQVGVARPAQMRVAESYNCIVFILITCAVVIDASLVLSADIVRNRIRIGRELDSAERSAGAGETMAHARCSDHRIDIAGHLGGKGCGSRTGQQQEKEAFHTTNLSKYRHLFYLCAQTSVCQA